jgi:hypothetical protein
MTDVRNPLDPTARWRATIDAMEAVMLAAPDAPEIEPTEAEEVRRLITMRLAAARRNSLPAAWTRRPGVVSPLVPDTRATPAPTDRTEPAPRAPHPATRPRLAWHE